MSYKPINLKLKVFEMSYCFVIGIVYVTNLLTNVCTFVRYNYCSIDGRRVTTCRVEQSGFEPRHGDALRCVLRQVTLLSQWSKASLHPGV